MIPSRRRIKICNKKAYSVHIDHVIFVFSKTYMYHLFYSNKIQILVVSFGLQTNSLSVFKMTYRI